MSLAIVAAGLLDACLSARGTAADAAARPNVLVIVADDAGWGDYSFTGNTNLATPAIDSLARDGAVLRQFCVQPVCAPTRAELLTGRYHPRSGVRGVTLGQERMDPKERTLARVFRDAGHATGCFGKWHNGTQWPYHPLARGFDTFYGFTEGHWGDYFDPPMEHDGRFVRGTGYIADDIATHAAEFIGRSVAAVRPFFCFVAFNTPHTPLAVPDAEWNRFRDHPVPLRGSAGDRENLPITRAVLAMMENLDTNVGRLLVALDRGGVADDTIVVFVSDNGPNYDRWCGGMRGHKASTDDGGVRSVCCIRWPRRIRGGTSVPQLAGAIDLLPTLAGLAGVDPGPVRPLDGMDLSPLLLGLPTADAVATRAADRTLVASFGSAVSVRSATHRLDARGRLYDIEADPGQTRDLATERPAEKARLAEVAERWRKDVLEATPRPTEERFPVGFPGAPHTELPARDGIPHGDVRRSAPAPNCSYFTNWKTVDDAISWKIDGLSAGRYEAVLWYTCSATDVGSRVVLRCGTGSLDATITPAWDPPPDPHPDRVPRRDEGHDKDFRPLSLGRIDLAKGPQELVLKADRIPGGGVADVRRIVLVPAVP
jgi:arylsulfatase A-like enzyme